LSPVALFGGIKITTMNFNYFTISSIQDLGNNYILLICSHDYGSAPELRLPLTGMLSDFTVGQRIEVEAKKV